MQLNFTNHTDGPAISCSLQWFCLPAIWSMDPCHFTLPCWRTEGTASDCLAYICFYHLSLIMSSFPLHI